MARGVLEDDLEAGCLVLLRANVHGVAVLPLFLVLVEQPGVVDRVGWIVSCACFRLRLPETVEEVTRDGTLSGIHVPHHHDRQWNLLAAPLVAVGFCCRKMAGMGGGAACGVPDADAVAEGVVFTAGDPAVAD